MAAIPAPAPWSPLLRGRRDECRELDLLVQTVIGGSSAVLVLRGEAGIGKTALLNRLADGVRGGRVIRVAGVQSEMELVYAGLHQLCGPLLDRLDTLPGPHRDALGVAFGLHDRGGPDQFLVALATLGLLSDAADEGPLVCLIDDAQWLDRASAHALAFVARRLHAERIALVFAVREPHRTAELDGLPELIVHGLPDADARLLLASGIPGRLDERVRDRIIAETRGNPLALLELPRGSTPAALAGGFGLPGTATVAGRLEQLFSERFSSLPPATRTLLLLASADPLGDVTLLWRAADLLDVPPESAGPAEQIGMVNIAATVRFRHPLVRSAVYRSAPPDQRRRVHGALAEATDAVTDPDRRAWHHAQATVGLDEEVAAELERSATRAQGRGGAAAAAGFLQRAAQLTPDPAVRGTRALAAARAELEAAAPDAAAELLAVAALCPLDDYQQAELALLQARVAFSLRRGSDAVPLLLNAAERLAPFRTGLTKQTYLEAFAAVLFAGGHGGSAGLRAVVAAARSVPSSGPDHPLEAMARGLAIAFEDGVPAAVPQLRTALEAFRDADERSVDVNRWLWLACRVASDLFDQELWSVLAERGVRVAREAGALEVLPIAAGYRAGVHLHAGEFDAAAALMDESAAISETTGTAPLFYTRPLLAAYRGDEAATLSMLAEAERAAADRGQGLALSMLGCARAVLHLGMGRYAEALTAAGPAAAHDGLGVYALTFVDLIEAAVRSGQQQLAAEALDRLARRARASGTDWALGLLARSQALLLDGPEAEGRYQAAVSRLSTGHVALHLARAQLLYGEWLRRENRRADSRVQLAAAHRLFEGFGAEAFAERARLELAATGQTARRRGPASLEQLTPQEARIAALAATGLTNPEIGDRLFISPRTVEYHLHKVFPKLGIGSRKELSTSLAPGSGVDSRGY